MTAELLSWGIEQGYIDARGRPQTTDPATIEKLARSLASRGTSHDRPTQVVVLRRHEPAQIRLPDTAGPVHWQLFANGEEIASADATDATVALPAGLEAGSYHLVADAADGGRRRMLVLIAPDMAYQPPLFRDGGRTWLLMVQLYAVRSARNWGHGDFSDLAQLLKIAGRVGAAGIGLNPLHALAPGQASAYSPSSRVFLNPLYIDVEAIPEFPGADACGATGEIARLQSSDVVDYDAVYAVKRKALRAAFTAFHDHATAARREDFAAFRKRLGEPLERFSTFETLREHFGTPWRQWPPEWQQSSAAHDRDKAGAVGDVAFAAFIQWVADAQLRACARMAHDMALPVGLYLDVAVGVDRDGADVWAAPDMLCQDLSIGAPPDVYNPRGQNWGLASLHPQALIDSDFSMFRQMLRSVMQYAGAIRIDHALGLYRLYLIPADSSAADGGYVRLPFAAMLAVVAQESASNRCLVIGEDLGTIPDGVCEALNQWGIWSYRVALFEREHNAFRRPEHFPEKAIVTFNTHDLPTFAGWKSSHDLKVKAALGVEAGESEAERQSAFDALRETLLQQGLASDLSFLDVLRYLARTRSQLLAVSIEDILGLCEQPNMPGTTTQYPNWRRRLPIDLDAVAKHETLHSVASITAAAGRGCAKAPCRVDFL
jgi:4-alpha-glucanotransferase